MFDTGMVEHVRCVAPVFFWGAAGVAWYPHTPVLLLFACLPALVGSCLLGFNGVGHGLSRRLMGVSVALMSPCRPAGQTKRHHPNLKASVLRTLGVVM